mgnify:CR=1 FL=1
MSNGISKPASQRLIKLVSLLEQLEEEAKVSKKDDMGGSIFVYTPKGPTDAA